MMREVGNDRAEHAHGNSIHRDRQTNRRCRCIVDIAQQMGLGDFATGDLPCGFDKGLFAKGCDAPRRGEPIEKGKEPLATAVLPKPVNLQKVERQVVGLACTALSSSVDLSGPIRLTDPFLL